tara:strand:+ start:625 stop:978 length:354 start_codon:yes stop_codon:yes gene_type:complete
MGPNEQAFNVIIQKYHYMIECEVGKPVKMLEPVFGAQENAFHLLIYIEEFRVLRVSIMWSGTGSMSKEERIEDLYGDAIHSLLQRLAFEEEENMPLPESMSVWADTVTMVKILKERE